MLKLIFLYILGITVNCYAGKAPFITPCKLDDKACALRSAQAAIPHVLAGIPELGVKPGDPLAMQDVQTEEGDLKLKFDSITVEGCAKCVLQSLDFSLETLKFVADCPIRAHGHYDVAGKLLFVPIEGNGPFEIKTEKVRLTVDAKLKFEDGKDGKQHFNIASLDYEYDPLEKFVYRLDNLFNGDETKAKPIVTVLNESWKEVITTIGKPIVNEIVHQVKEHIIEFLKAVPAEELYLA